MAVGFRTGTLVDPARRAWDDTGPRPIRWSAWYPAAGDAASAPMRAGGPAADWFDLGDVARDAPLEAASTSLPVALLSHGTGGTAASLGWLGRRLAARGHVALAVNHHGNTALEPSRPEGFLCWWERARDLTVLLDALDHDATFAGRLDPGRIVAIGFSLGTHTAVALLGGLTDMERFRAWAARQGGPFARGPSAFPDLADRFPVLLKTSAPFRAAWQRRDHSYRDPRVGAALLLAPAPPVRAFTDDSLVRIAAPVHMMVGGADAEAPADLGALWLAERIPGSTVADLGPHVGHFVFLPEATEEGRRQAPHLCNDAPGVDRATLHDAVLKAALRLVQA